MTEAYVEAERGLENGQRLTTVTRKEKIERGVRHVLMALMALGFTSGSHHQHVPFPIRQASSADLAAQKRIDADAAVCIHELNGWMLVQLPLLLADDGVIGPSDFLQLLREASPEGREAVIALADEAVKNPGLLPVIVNALEKNASGYTDPRAGVAALIHQFQLTPQTRQKLLESASSIVDNKVAIREMKSPASPLARALSRIGFH